MILENGCLILEYMDLEKMAIDVDNGILVEETFSNLLHISGIGMNDIMEIQANAPDLVPFEDLILSIITLLSR